jgi:hypothetical protein
MEQIDKNIKLLTPDKKMGCYIDSSTRSMWMWQYPLMDISN